MHDFAKRGRKTLGKIEFSLGTIRRLDHPVKHIILPGEFSGGQKLAIPHAAQLPIPFARSLEAQVQFEKF